VPDAREGVSICNALRRLGEHMEEILAWLGYDAAHIERLRQEHVV
jgi:crotonobetainyl-CoA:carnitine CoA-transferase CaiB-like acyl-CoA transferase